MNAPRTPGADRRAGSRLGMIRRALTMTGVGLLVAAGSPLFSVVSHAAVSSAVRGQAVPLGAGDVSGSVFRDFNANGVKDTREPGQSGITVTAFGTNGAVYGPVVTDAAGAYTISGVPAGEKLRVEASGLASWLSPSPVGSANGSLVRFATAGDTSVNMAVMNPADYCQSNPDLILPCFLNGAQAESDNVLYRLPFGGATASGSTGGTGIAAANQIGTTYGVAYQRSNNRAFASSYVRRHTGILNNKPGQLYKIDNPSAATPTVSAWVDLGAIGIPVGSVPVNGVVAGQRDLGTKNGAGALSRDPVAGLVGKTGIGDIDISEDDTTLYVVSLSGKSLYKVVLPVDGSAPTAANVTDLGLGTGACDQPFGLKPLDAKVYVGVTCTSSLAAEVRVYDLASGTWNVAPALSINLGYTKGCAVTWTGPFGCSWNNWVDTPDATWEHPPTVRPTALLSDIGFADNGDMIVGFRDRTGDQVGFFNYLFQGSGDPATTVEGTSGGDLLRACKTATGFVLQGGAGCAVKTANNQGPGAGEWYSADNFTGGHEETSNGAVVTRRGSGLLGGTQMDPINIRAGGITTYNDDAGTKNAGFQVFAELGSANASTGTGRMGKANGLGDVELLCDAAPVEVGNRVWLDLNGNGVQDANEPPIAGVTVKLQDSTGTGIGTAITDSNGNYLFSGGAGTTSSAAVYGIAGLKPGTNNYKITIDPAQPALAKYKPTTPNAAALAGDTTQADSDSNGVLNGAKTAVEDMFNTGRAGANDHTHDFGFIPPYSLGNRVWLDDGAGGGVVDDGLINGSEAGVNGVSVKLFTADNSGNAAAKAKDLNGTDVADLATAGGGYYRFDNLPPGRYVVCVDKPGSPALAGTRSSSGAGQKADPDTDIDNDDNGLDTPMPVGSICPGGTRSGVIDLLGSEPTNDTDGGAIAATEAPDDRSNRTVDFGFSPAYSLGNRVWIDTNDDGLISAGELGKDGVTVNLVNPTTGAVIATMTTANGGYYRFDDLAPGSYKVVIAPSNFAPGGALAGYLSSTPTVADPNSDIDNDDNGIQPSTVAAYATDGVMSGIVTLGPTEPVGETDKNAATASTDAPDARSNLTVDFGFRLPPGTTATTTTTTPTTPPVVIAPTTTAPPTAPTVPAPGATTTPPITPTTAAPPSTLKPPAVATTVVGPTGTVGCDVFLDRDRNAKHDPTEPGIPGVMVQISGPGGPGQNLVTVGSGRCSETPLAPGTYTLTITGGLKASASGSRTQTVTVVAGSSAISSFPISATSVEAAVENSGQISPATVAFTGSNTDRLVTFALGLLMLGLAGLLSSRIRRIERVATLR